MRFKVLWCCFGVKITFRKQPRLYFTNSFQKGSHEFPLLRHHDPPTKVLPSLDRGDQVFFTVHTILYYKILVQSLLHVLPPHLAYNVTVTA